MITVINLENLAFPLKVEQGQNNLFTVTYGTQTKRGLSYEKAAQEFGECMFHALACEGTLRNKVKEETK
jgi:hypothetical protein